MKPFNGSTIDQLKNVTHTTGAFPFATLIKPNVILTYKSSKEIGNVTLGNPEKTYPVAYAINHIDYNLTFLILKKNVEEDIATPVPFAENISHEFLKNNNIQFLFTGSLLKPSKTNSNVLKLSGPRGISTLNLTLDSFNSSLTKANLGLHILPAYTKLNAQFKYGSYDQGGAILCKINGVYKLVGMVVKPPINFEDFDKFSIKNSILFYDIETIQNWLNEISIDISEKEKDILGNSIYAKSEKGSAFSSSKNRKKENPKKGNLRKKRLRLSSSDKDEKKLRKFKKKRRKLDSNKPEDQYKLRFKPIADIDPALNSKILILNKNTILQPYSLNENKSILLDNKTFELTCGFKPIEFSFKIYNLETYEHSLKIIPIADINSVDDLLETKLFIFGKKDENDYRASFIPKDFFADRKLDNLEITFNVNKLDLGYGIYCKSDKNYKLVGVFSKNLYKDTYKAEFITQDIKEKIIEFAQAPYIDVKFKNPIYKSDVKNNDLLLNKRMVLSSRDSLPEYNDVSHPVTKSIYPFSNNKIQIKFLEYKLKGVEPISIYNFDDPKDLENKKLIVYGMHYEEGYEGAFQIENSSAPFFKIQSKRKNIDYQLGIFIEDQNEFLLVGLLLKEYTDTGYYNVFWLTKDVKQRIESFNAN